MHIKNLQKEYDKFLLIYFHKYFKEANFEKESSVGNPGFS